MSLWAQPVHASATSLHCSIIHAGPAKQAQNNPSVEVEALEQIQKDLTGNRPLLAVIRSSKRDPKLEVALVHIVQSLPREVRVSVSAQTGYAIEQGRLVLRQEVKAISKEWSVGFIQEALKNVKSLLEARGKAKPQVMVRHYKPTPVKKAEFIEVLYAHLLKFYLLKEADGYSGLYMRHFRERLKNELLPTREAILYFLMSGGRTALDMETSVIYQIVVEANPQLVSEVYNFFHPENAVTAEDVVRATRRFPEMVKEKEREVFRELSMGRQAEVENETSRVPETKSSSLKELIQDLDAPSAEVVSTRLITLIQSVDSSDPQMKRLAEVSQDPQPQLRLLELAYALKRHHELTQKEIQNAIYASLDEITNPGAPQEAAPVAIEKIEPNELAVAESSVRDSKSRTAKMKRDLQSPNSAFHLLIHNEKDFFDLLKPGTGRFESVEKDIEVLRQKFARVFSYFNGNPKVLPGDGHFSITNRRIFDLKYGPYRLLMTKSRASEDLVVLVVFDKNDGGNVKKEKRFYDLAGDRLIRGGY